jgi:hypothetical protein
MGMLFVQQDVYRLTFEILGTDAVSLQQLEINLMVSSER